MALQPISFRWDQNLINRIDKARGPIPRSRWVQDILEAKLNPKTSVQPKPHKKSSVPPVATTWRR